MLDKVEEKKKKGHLVNDEKLLNSQQTENSAEESAQFLIEDMFVSSTDSKGLIRSGNQIFSEISGYSLAEMINQPHNIIRHPDVPRAVFKNLWTRIKNGQPNFYYVKNKTKQGKYYWMFATVFPCAHGYLSIRIKPSSSIFKAVEKLYQETVAVEKQKGMDAGLSYMEEQQRALGFESYEKFMLAAMMAENSSRQKHLKERGSVFAQVTVPKKDAVILDLEEYIRFAQDEMNTAAQLIEQIHSRQVSFLEHADKLRKACTRLQFL